jgi:hypothetical protein
MNLRQAPGLHRHHLAFACLLALLAFSGIGASSALAAKVHLFKEALGGASAPTFSRPLSVAVDQSGGKILVLDGGVNEVQTLKIAAGAGQFRLTYGGRTTTATATGDTSTVTTPKVIKNVSGVIGTFTRGEAISGTGIPAGATISKIISATEIEISANATATNTGVSLTAGGLPFNISTTNLKSALEDLLAPTFTTPIAVSGSIGSPAGGTYTITFNSRDVNELVVSDGTTPLSGGSPSTEKVVATPTQGVNAGIRRFNSDGSVANFTALGSNTIDGQRGPGGKTRAECEAAPEPASCDETPQNGILVPASAFNVQIAVDNSGGPTDGNIYLTQREAKSIDVFGKTGKYLGQLTAAGAVPFAGEPSGVAVAPSGRVYVGQSGAPANKAVFEFAPAANPPVNADFVRSLTLANVGIPANVAAGAGGGPRSTLGSVFAAKNSTNPIVKVNSSFAEAFSFGSGALVAVNPGANGGTVFVSNGNVSTEYDASSATGPAVQESTLTASAGTTIQGLAVDGANGNVYLTRTGSSNVEVFGPVVSTPNPLAFDATDLSVTKATLNGSVNAEGNAVTVCKFEYLTQAAYQANGNSFSGANVPQTKSCLESIPVDSSAHPVSASLSALQANTTYRFRLFAENGAGSAVSAVKSFATSPTAFTGQASPIGDTTATLNGTVNPVGVALTACKFEYLTAAAYAENGNGYSGPNVPASKACTPPAESIEADFQAHAVSAPVTGLAKNTTYHFRLSATTTSGTVVGSDQTFLTLGPPRVIVEYADSQGIDSARLNAKINPSGFATTYRFEWGPDATYGHRVPAEADLFAGSGTTEVLVNANLTGLTPSSTYHFRIVATNASGTTEGPDRSFTTLNSDGLPDLPDGRVAELVSPADKRPSGLVGWIGLADTEQIIAQGARDGGDQFVYPILNGIGSSTAGGFLRELGERTSTGWESSQISAPSLVEAPSIQNQGFALPSTLLYSTPNLNCSFVSTPSPVTDDTPAASVELGLQNLYLWTKDGGYRLLSDRVPLNPSPNFETPFSLAMEASEDCSRLYFSSKYELIAGASGFYEWDDGTLRDAGVLPNGNPGTGVVLGGETGVGSTGRYNAVSPDGSRVFFSAISNAGPDAGTRAIFMRSGRGASVVDISQSQTGVPTRGARFEAASADGKYVFFQANYGIATTTSAGGATADCSQTPSQLVESLQKANCDLYRYEVATGDLKDLSADSNPADTQGAQSLGTVAVSKDGSHVYFATLGQLIPGKGKTYAENTPPGNAGFANVYLWSGGNLSYVVNLGQRTADPKDIGGDLLGGGSDSNAALMRKTGVWGAATTADGEKLLFASKLNITGYDSGGIQEAYLFDRASGSITCVSCRPDGLPSVFKPDYSAGVNLQLDGSPFQSLAVESRFMSEDGSRIFFKSPDALAPGGIAFGENFQGGSQPPSNLYEWKNGQVHFLAILRRSGGNGLGGYLSASPDGSDVFLVTAEQLAPQDNDFVSDVYDLRVGGGFAADIQPRSCDPANDECQGATSVAPPAPEPGSASFSGSGNASPGGSRCRKGFVVRHRKCVRKTKHHRRRSGGRTAGSRRGGGK